MPVPTDESQTPLPPFKLNKLGLLRLVAIVAVIAVFFSIAIRSCGSDASRSTSATTTSAAETPSPTADAATPTTVRPLTPPVGLISNPDSTLVLVDRDRFFAPDHRPADLVTTPILWAQSQEPDREMLRAEAAQHAVALFGGAYEAGNPLIGVSGFRSFDRQKGVHDRSVERNGPQAGDRYTAAPGHSEHQSGLALDVTEANGTCATELCFADTAAARWLEANAHRYGFVIRYPKDREATTGYSYEPWHLRYLGIAVATEIHANNITFDQWFRTR